MVKPIWFGLGNMNCQHQRLRMKIISVFIVSSLTAPRPLTSTTATLDEEAFHRVPRTRFRRSMAFASRSSKHLLAEKIFHSKLPNYGNEFEQIHENFQSPNLWISGSGHLHGIASHTSHTPLHCRRSIRGMRHQGTFGQLLRNTFWTEWRQREITEMSSFCPLDSSHEMLGRVDCLSIVYQLRLEGDQEDEQGTPEGIQESWQSLVHQLQPSDLSKVYAHLSEEYLIRFGSVDDRKVVATFRVRPNRTWPGCSEWLSSWPATIRVFWTAPAQGPQLPLLSFAQIWRSWHKI